MKNFAKAAAIALLPLLAACAGTGPVASTPAGQAARPVTIGIAAINDFHGALEVPRTAVTIGNDAGGTTAIPAGGAAYLASAVDSIKARYPNHLTVAAGDLIGATQLSSSLFLDEPAIGVMNRIGLDFNAVGNHEFDRGRDELKRKASGGCAKYTLLTPCRLEKFSGAGFTYLAANSIEPDGKTLFAPSAIRSFGKGRQKVKIGLIGLTLKATADLSSREGLKGIRFADEAETVNALIPRLKAQGADAIAVLIHQGGYTKGDRPDPSQCPNLTGEIRAVLDRLDPRVDLVISGHTHWAYVCDYAQYNPARPFLLTSAGVSGQLVTDISLDIDPLLHKVVAKRASNVIVQNQGYQGKAGLVAPSNLAAQFAPRADVAAYVARYVDAAKLEILGENARVLLSHQSVLLRQGERFRVAGLASSACAYLAVEGGMSVPDFLGSASTYVRGGLGGFEGRALRPGDALHLAKEAVEERPELRLRRAPEIDRDVIRVVLGPQDDFFDAAVIATFLQSEWRISRDADRMGMRLEGPKLAHKAGYDIVSDGIVTGAIQVPGSGQPILLLADHQTTGGYPKIATVISADLPAVGRRRPGSTIRFAAVAVEGQPEIRRAQEQDLIKLLAGAEAVAQEPTIDLNALYSRNLISGVVG